MRITSWRWCHSDPHRTARLGRLRHGPPLVSRRGILAKVRERSRTLGRNRPLATASPRVWGWCALLLTALFFTVHALVANQRAHAADGAVHGQVIESSSRWGYGSTIIVTETTVRVADGSFLTTHQLGGVVGDIGMKVSHSPELLPVGAWVELETTPAVLRNGRRLDVVGKILSISSSPLGTFPFVRTTNDNNTSLFWESGCALIGMESGGSDDIPDDLEIDAIERSVASWREALSECSYLNFEFLGPVNTEPGFDGFSVIRFREDRWCRPATESDPETCHDPSAAGLTFLTFGVAGDRDGAILDADIELNGVDFGLVVGGVGNTDRPCSSDLENTLTHELGHFLGLDHTCWDGRGARPVDGNGDPVPDCFPVGALSSEITEATMYPFQECDETKKISLSPDDKASMCAIYATANDPGTCSWPAVGSGGFCSTTGSTGSGKTPAALLLLAMLTLVPRRRR